MTKPFSLNYLYQPITLQVDFRDPGWAISRTVAWGWLVGAVAADWLAQYLVGKPSPLTLGASLLSLVLFGPLPVRLSGAIGGLLVTQALVSLLVVRVSALSGNSLAVELVPLLWSGWCLFALARLILTYIRTPKQLW